MLNYCRILQYIRISSRSLIIVIIIGDQIKNIWDKLVEGYKDFVKNGKKIPPSGDGARKMTISRTTYDLFKFMSFLDGRLEHHNQITSIPSTSSYSTISMKKNTKRSIWDDDLEYLSSEEDIMPPEDKFCRKKKKISNKQHADELSELFGCVKDLTQVMKDNLGKKNCNDAYETKINSFFQDFNEAERNYWLQKMLVIINREISQ